MFHRFTGKRISTWPYGAVGAGVDPTPLPNPRFFIGSKQYRAAADPEWVEGFDEDSGFPYWYHTKSGEYRWENPNADAAGGAGGAAPAGYEQLALTDVGGASAKKGFCTLFDTNSRTNLPSR